MENVKDCTENNQNTERLFLSHEHCNKTSKVVTERSEECTIESPHNWTEFDFDRQAESHSWVAAAVSHLNNNSNSNNSNSNNSNSNSNSNNNNIQHCKNKQNNSDNVGFDVRQEVLSGCSKWSKKTVQKPWNCDKCDDLSAIDATAIKSESDTNCTNEMRTNGGGNLETTPSALSKLAALVIHDAPLSPIHHSVSGACCLDYNDSDLEDEEQNYTTLGAAAINILPSKQCIILNCEEPADIGSCARTHSNRTSINNSTENLSYSSDNFYANDLLLLDEQADMEAEEISLNSDDCIYAYRGDGAEFDLVLDDVVTRRVGICAAGAIGEAANVDNEGAVDDETEFLEMDFEPDPLSEAEYSTMGVDMSANTFLMQRNSCQLSGRHSDSNVPQNGNALARQHFSSPSEELPMHTKALQTQTMMSKNFACINLHLDQINETMQPNSSTGAVGKACSASAAVTIADSGHTLAQSLPNTLHEHFKCGANETALNNINRAEQMLHVHKLTGAKPKRVTSKPVSNKGRSSRSAMGAVYMSSNSFDERSLSCNEFRCTGLESVAQQSMDCLVVAPMTADVAEQNSDEACLDCLEREFLASTIGKSLEPHKECVKCRKRSSSSSITLYETAEKIAQRCRSNGPPTSFFFEHGTQIDSCLFATSTEFLTSAAAATTAQCTHEWFNPLLGERSLRTREQKSNTRQSDVEIGEKLLKNLILTEKKSCTVSTVNICEDSLTQTLDNLNIIYNQELLKNYFARSNLTNNNNDTEQHDKQQQQKLFKNLKDFLIYESKRQGNYPELKRIIEKATRHQVTVKFQKTHERSIEMELLPVKVGDILHQWARNKDLTVLLQLGNRFAETNVVGKMANLIRQSEQRCSIRPLPEFITIPQYYPTGELVITKNF